jgi:hypothetical protein
MAQRRNAPRFGWSVTVRAARPFPGWNPGASLLALVRVDRLSKIAGNKTLLVRK